MGIYSEKLCTVQWAQSCCYRSEFTGHSSHYQKDENEGAYHLRGNWVIKLHWLQSETGAEIRVAVGH